MLNQSTSYLVAFFHWLQQQRQQFDTEDFTMVSNGIHSKVSFFESYLIFFDIFFSVIWTNIERSNDFTIYWRQNGPSSAAF